MCFNVKKGSSKKLTTVREMRAKFQAGFLKNDALFLNPNKIPITPIQIVLFCYI